MAAAAKDVDELAEDLVRATSGAGDEPRLQVQLRMLERLVEIRVELQAMAGQLTVTNKLLWIFAIGTLALAGVNVAEAWWTGGPGR